MTVAKKCVKRGCDWAQAKRIVEQIRQIALDYPATEANSTRSYSRQTRYPQLQFNSLLVPEDCDPRTGL